MTAWTVGASDWPGPVLHSAFCINQIPRSLNRSKAQQPTVLVQRAKCNICHKRHEESLFAQSASTILGLSQRNYVFEQKNSQDNYKVPFRQQPSSSCY